MNPSYLELLEGGELHEVALILFERMADCDLCPRKCGANRLGGEIGYCGASSDLEVSSFTPHFGEERPLVGSGGSGTIFFTHCPLKCCFCQNYDISILGSGERIGTRACADMMLRLQEMGCHNINLVTPTHYTPQIVSAVEIAANNGLRIPLVWNCGGYEGLESIKALDGIVDIYMPDIKFYSSKASNEYLGVDDYFERCSESVVEMHRQVGDLHIEEGLAQRGLLIRHLVMPGHREDSEGIIDFVSSLSKDSYLNIMDQYRPQYKSFEHPEIDRTPYPDEVEHVRQYARKVGLQRGF